MRIKTFLNKAKGVEVSVHMLKNGRYNVSTYDIDEMHYAPEKPPQFLDRGLAIKFAKGVVA